MKLRGKFKILRVNASDAEKLEKLLRAHATPAQEEGEKAAGSYLIPPEIVKSFVGIADPST